LKTIEQVKEYIHLTITREQNRFVNAKYKLTKDKDHALIIIDNFNKLLDYIDSEDANDTSS